MLGQWNRRTTDQLAAKVYFYLARAFEVQGRLAELHPSVVSEPFHLILG